MQMAIVERKKKYYFLMVDRAFPAMSESAEFDEIQARNAPRSTSRPNRFSNPDRDSLLCRIAFPIRIVIHF